MLIDTEELLEELYKKFPDEVPDKVSDMRCLGIKVGEQRALKYIEHYLESKQHEADQSAKKLKS